MKRKFVTKLLITLVATLMLLISNFSYCSVKAVNETEQNYSLDEIFNTDEKIMMYDATTDETTEVNMQELRQEVKKLIKEDGNIRLNSSFTNELIYNSKILSTYSTKASYNRITDMNSFNARTTCKIKSDQGSASGSIVGNSVALTAAHCIWNENTKEKYTNLKFYPGYSNGNSYKGLSCGWSKVYYSNNWMNNSNPNAEYDWAICVLEQPLGKECGFLGARSYSLAEGLGMVSTLADLYGYPIVYDSGKYLYEMGTYITSCTNTVFTYNGNGYNGFSGGPVLGYNSGDIIAVHSSATSTESAGVRITSNMISIINDLRK